MPVTSVTSDPTTLTITLEAEFPVPVERLWQAFADPRQLERFWGPPGYPATFGDFDLRPGGRVHYWMTSPEGERMHAEWHVTAVDEPREIRFTDVFTDEHGTPAEGMPTFDSRLTLEATATGSRFALSAEADSVESLEAAAAMGMLEGYREVGTQLDLVLADLREFALGKGTVTEVVDETHVKITRAFEAPRSLLWRAYTEPELMKRWLLGPDGWEMTVCENDLVPGGAYRNAWAPVGDTAGEPFGFEGENLVVDPQRRLVNTERMTGAPFPPNINDVLFDEADGVTLMTMYITYPDMAQRDMILATGMTDGMEASFARLERELITA